MVSITRIFTDTVKGGSVKALTIKDLLQGVLDGKYNLDDSLAVYVYAQPTDTYEYVKVVKTDKQLLQQVDIFVEKIKEAK